MISSRSNPPILAPEPAYSLPLPGPEDESSQGGISVAQVIHILRAHMLYSVAILVTVLSLAAIGIKLLPKSYVATATLIVNFENRDPLAGRDPLAETINTFIPTQIELITSRGVLQQVAARLNLAAYPEFNGGFKGPADATMDVVVKNLSSDVQVLQGAGSQLLHISATSKYPLLAAEIANATADEYLKQQRQRTSEPAAERAERYSKELGELRAKAIAAQDRVTEFRQQHNMTDIDAERGDLEGAALVDLQAKLQDAQNQRRALEARQVDPNANSDSVLDSATVLSLRDKLSQQEAQMAELRATLGPKHPKVVELDQQMASTRRSLAAEVQSISANSAVQLARARELEAKFQSAINTERQRLLERRGLQDQAAKLTLELQSAQATYKKALDGYDQIEFASSGNFKDVSLVSRAQAPVKSEKPNKVKLFLMAIVVSLGLAIGVPLAYELFLARRLRCRDDLEKHFGFPVLAQFGPMTTSRA